MRKIWMGLLIAALPLLAAAQPLVLTIPDRTVNTNETLIFQIKTDSLALNDTLVFGAAAGSLPPGAEFNINSGIFSWKPTANQSGRYNVIFTAKSSSGRTGSKSAGITVVLFNHDPKFLPIGGKSIAAGKLLEFSVTATDQDGDSLYYSAENLPPDAVFDQIGRKFTWQPPVNQARLKKPVLFTVTDLQGGADTARVSIALSSTQYPPHFPPGVEKQTVSEGEALEFNALPIDTNGGSFRFLASGKPQGMDVDESAGAFKWKPDYNTAPGHDTVISFKLTVLDNTNLADSVTVCIKVLDTPDWQLMRSRFDNAVQRHEELTGRIIGAEAKARTVYRGRKKAKRIFELSGIIAACVGLGGQYADNEHFQSSSAKASTAGSALLAVIATIWKSPEEPLKLLTAVSDIKKANKKAYEAFITPWSLQPSKESLISKTFGRDLARYSIYLNAADSLITEAEGNELILEK